MTSTMSARLRALAGAASFAMLGLPGLPGPSPLPSLLPAQGSPAPAAGTTGKVALPGEVLAGLDRLTPAAPTASGRVLTIGVGLFGSDPHGEAAYIHSEYSSSSPLYHRFLTPAEFDARFGVPAARYQAAVSWLRAGGLQVSSIPGSTTYLEASGDTAQVERLLGVHIYDFRFRGATYYANVDAPQVPASLQIAGINSLNSFEAPRLATGESPLRPARQPAALKPATPDPNMNIGLTTPQDLWGIYDQPDSDMGQGQKMAIFGWGSTTTTLWDLRLEEYEFHLPAVPFGVRYIGPRTESIQNFSEGEGEWNIDTQASTGMAPKAAGETLYFGKQGTDADLVGAYNTWAADPRGALQGSSSFSGCEQTPVFGSVPPDPTGALFLNNPNQYLWEAALERAVSEGRTMFASTGDSGAGCPSNALVVNGATIEPTPMAAYPADSTWAVGVGGTVVYWDPPANGRRSSRAFEYGWTHGGGGQSLFEPAFDAQAVSGVTAVRCLSDAYGNPYQSTPPICRAIPDVSAQSGDILSNGYTVAAGGTFDQSAGGTSLSSPIWLGLWTRLQAASPNRGGAGFAEDVIYRDVAQHPQDFFDVGGPGVGTAPSCNGQYCSHLGWDYVTGFGPPDLTRLIQHVDGRLTPTHPSRVAAAPTTIFRLGGTNGGSCQGTQVVDGAGDAADGYPGGSGEQLPYYDVRGVRLSRGTDSSGAPVVNVTMSITDLEDPGVPPVQIGGQWDVYWQFRKDSDQLEADDNAGSWSLFFLQNGNYNLINGGEVYGPGGSVTWQLPLSLLTTGEAAASPKENLSFIHAATLGTLEVQGNGLRYTATADNAPNLGYGADFPVGGTRYCPRPPKKKTHARAAAGTTYYRRTSGTGGPGGMLAGAPVAVVVLADTGGALGAVLALLVLPVLMARRRQRRPRSR